MRPPTLDVGVPCCTDPAVHTADGSTETKAGRATRKTRAARDGDSAGVDEDDESETGGAWVRSLPRPAGLLKPNLLCVPNVQDDQEYIDGGARKPVRQFACPGFPAVGDTFPSCQAAHEAAAAAMIPVYGNGLDASKAHLIRCNQHGQGCPVQIHLGAGGRPWRVLASSVFEHNHGRDPRIVKNPAWRPVIKNAAARRAVERRDAQVRAFSSSSRSQADEHSLNAPSTVSAPRRFRGSARGTLSRMRQQPRSRPWGSRARPSQRTRSSSYQALLPQRRQASPPLLAAAAGSQTTLQSQSRRRTSFPPPPPRPRRRPAPLPPQLPPAVSASLPYSTRPRPTLPPSSPT